MISKVKFKVKQILKMAFQNLILPCVYRFWALVYRAREPQLVIFADAHHKTLPVSMERLHAALVAKGYSVVDEICDFSAMSLLRQSLTSLRFMKRYAQAKYVFICDAFLPVASCKKSKKTTVVQLLHSCGLLKKFGYDTTEDIPAGYIGHIYRNYDLVTVSAPCCVEPLRNAMHQDDGIVQALGVSRTDNYFDEAWLEACRTRFYDRHPEAKGKTVILWAPTFRGNAGDPEQVGTEDICRLEQQLGDGYYVVKKVHPHVERKYPLSNCALETEEILPVTDLLISDYSSVINEFMFFEKPYVLFAPDLHDFEAKRGFYVPYGSLGPYIVTEADALCGKVMEALADKKPAWVAAQREFHLGSCDGHATERILEYLGL